MGDHYDTSELPTVVRIDEGGGPRYQVYDGNRRVILALLQQEGSPGTGTSSSFLLSRRVCHATYVIRTPRWNMSCASIQQRNVGQIRA